MLKVMETLYSISLNTALGHYKCSSKFAEKQESYLEICELIIAGMWYKTSKYSSKTMIPSRQVTTCNWNFIWLVPIMLVGLAWIFEEKWLKP